MVLHYEVRLYLFAWLTVWNYMLLVSRFPKGIIHSFIIVLDEVSYVVCLDALTIHLRHLRTL